MRDARSVANLELNGLVSLADITLTPATVREATAGKPHQNVPRLTAEPIASRLAEAARLDLTRDLSEAVPRYSGLLHQRLDDNLALSARIEQATPVGVETTRDGAWLIADLTGTLTLTYERRTTTAVASTAQKPTVETSPRLSGGAAQSCHRRNLCRRERLQMPWRHGASRGKKLREQVDVAIPIAELF